MLFLPTLVNHEKQKDLYSKILLKKRQAKKLSKNQGKQNPRQKFDRISTLGLRRNMLAINIAPNMQVIICPPE